MQKGTIVEKLIEEVVRDDQHLRHLISICEGYKQLIIFLIIVSNMLFHFFIPFSAKKLNKLVSSKIMS